MPVFVCNYQPIPTDRELDEVRESVLCWHCGELRADLIKNGQALEYCGAEHMPEHEGTRAERYPIALCPSCHALNHKDAKGQHNPCQFSAQRSRESFSEDE